METKPWERLLSWVLTVIMVINMVPVEAFAANTEDHTGHDHTIETIVPGEDSTGESTSEPTPPVEEALVVE